MQVVWEQDYDIKVKGHHVFHITARANLAGIQLQGGRHKELKKRPKRFFDPVSQHEWRYLPQAQPKEVSSETETTEGVHFSRCEHPGFLSQILSHSFSKAV